MTDPGESITTSGEDQPGQDSGEQGTKGPAARPHGTTGDESSGASSSDDTGIGQTP